MGRILAEADPSEPEYLVRLMDEPVPVRITAADDSPGSARVLDPGIKQGGRFCEFRAVDWDRLPTILSAGIDVEPFDAVIYASSFEKAYEYGGILEVVMALDMEPLGPSFRILSPDAKDAEIQDFQVPTLTSMSWVTGLVFRA